MKKENEDKKESKCIVRHFLSDGTQVESMKGRVVPYNERTKMAYMILAGVNRVSK